MASLFLKKLISVSPFFPSSRLDYLTVMFPLFHFSTQTQQKDELPFIAQYLISSFGFSKERAIKVAAEQNLAPIKTPDRPESVICFLKDTGLTDAQVKMVISSSPHLLARSVSKTLEPWTREVIKGGFTRDTLIQLIRYSPMCFAYSNPLPRLRFWRDFVSNEQTFLKLIKNRMFINADIDKKIVPRINLLREYGFSDKQIADVIIHTLFQSPASIKLRIEQIKELGIPLTSKMFIPLLSVLAGLKKDTVERKLEFLKKTCGWSEEEMQHVLKKYPAIIGLSEDNVISKINFLTQKAGVNSKFLVAHPALLGYSLEKRLVPRNYVLSVLKSKGLITKCDIYTLVSISEVDFVRRFIERYEKEVPDLSKSYAAACAGKMCD